MRKIYSLFAMALLFAGCSLDVVPETDITDATFWKSEVDLRAACNRLYIDLGVLMHDKRSEELVGPNQDGISSSNRSVPNTSGDWTDPYNRIGVCNNIITKTAGAPIDQAIKDRWTAEAYFFRAYNYFDLVKKYGDVPLILTIFDTPFDPEISKGRDPREAVIQQCYKDLEFAIEHLPAINEVTGTNWGRVSKSAALGVMVRIGLYEGTHKKYHQTPGGDYKAHLQKAITAAETMMYTDKKHALYPDFAKLFLWEGEGEGNKESVFIKAYGPNTSGIVHGFSRGLENAVALTRSMLDNFLYNDGLPREKSPLVMRPEVKLNDIFVNREPRLALTLYSVGEIAYKDTPYSPFVTSTQTHGSGYPIKKGFIQSEWATTSKEILDKMIIRYAEILISYAEALYEHNGSITDAKLDETVNALRNRVGFEVKLTNAFVEANSLNMLDEIRRERMIEFIDESLHYDDIIRWKTAEKVLPKAVLGLLFNATDTDNTTANSVLATGRLTDANGNYKGEKLSDQGNLYVIESRSFNPARDYLYPVPTYEINTTDRNVTQNPGWD